jgi:hypothetical protein
MDLEEVFEADENAGRVKIAQQERTVANKTHYEVAYQGALVQRLEEREEQAVLEGVRSAAGEARTRWFAEMRIVAEQQMGKLLGQPSE